MLCSSCKPKVKLQVDEVNILAYTFDLPQKDSAAYDWQFLAYGFSKITSNFSTQIIKRENYRGKYLQENIILSDSLKQRLNRAIIKYSNDSIFNIPENEEGSLLYCGPSYMFIIKKGNQYIHLSGIPYSYPDDLRELLDAIYIHQDVTKFKSVENSDSVQQAIDSLEKHVKRPEIPLPINLIHHVEFTPPLVK